LEVGSLKNPRWFEFLDYAEQLFHMRRRSLPDFEDCPWGHNQPYAAGGQSICNGGSPSIPVYAIYEEILVNICVHDDSLVNFHLKTSKDIATRTGTPEWP
jgi:hypothetical protein